MLNKVKMRTMNLKERVEVLAELKLKMDNEKILRDKRSDVEMKISLTLNAFLKFSFANEEFAGASVGTSSEEIKALR